MHQINAKNYAARGNGNRANRKQRCAVIRRDSDSEGDDADGMSSRQPFQSIVS
jgi:hypothetical protein